MLCGRRLVCRHRQLKKKNYKKNEVVVVDSVLYKEVFNTMSSMNVFICA